MNWIYLDSIARPAAVPRHDMRISDVYLLLRACRSEGETQQVTSFLSNLHILDRDPALSLIHWWVRACDEKDLPRIAKYYAEKVIIFRNFLIYFICVMLALFRPSRWEVTTC